MYRFLYSLLSVILINFSFISEVIASNWVALQTTPTLDTYYDKDSVNGPPNKTQITIAQNIKELVNDGVKSRLMGYEIDCIQKTSLFKTLVIYDAPNLTSTGNSLPIQTQVPTPINPTSIGELMFNVACSKNAQTSQTQNTNLISPILPGSEWRLVFSGTGQIYVDIKHMLGDYGNRTIFVKRNGLGDTNSSQALGAKSVYRRYSIACNTSEYKMEEETAFSEPDLQGSLLGKFDYTKINPYAKIVPTGAAAQYVAVACAGMDLNAAIAATTTAPLTKYEVVSPGAIIPNLSIVTGFPKFPMPPNPNAYQIMGVEGNSTSTQRISLQIFSDGQAPFISNGASRFLMHTGNGVFVDQDNKVILDEKNSQISINGLIVKDVQFVKSPPPPPPSSQTYGEKLRFFGELKNAIDETDLMAGCTAAADLASKRQWANNTALQEAWFFGVCMSTSMASDKNYWLGLSKWKEKLKNEDTSMLFIYTERCWKDYKISFAMKKNSIGQYSKECAGVSNNH